MKKYKLTEETKHIGFGTLYRICAIRDFGDVKAGDMGGWIESEKNLSHEGNAWVYDNARVSGDALVCGNARVFGDAQVCGDAEVRDNALVCGNAKVCGDALVCGNARVFGDAEVCGNAEVRDNALVCGDAEVRDNARVCGNAKVCGDAKVRDNALVCGNAKVHGNAEVCGDAQVCGANDWVEINNIGSRNSVTTFYRNKDKGISVSCGCFSGTLEEFVKAVKETHGDNQYAKEYMAAIELAKARIL